MTFPSGPSGTPSGRSGGNSGFGTPRPGFGSPAGSSGGSGHGGPPPFGSRPQSPGSYPGAPTGGGSANAQPVFGGGSTPPPGQAQSGQPQSSFHAPNQPPQQPQTPQYSAPTSPQGAGKGKGRFSGAIGALIALLVVLAIVLGVGAWFIWGRDSADAAQAGASSEQTSTAALAGTPISTHGSIDTDLTEQDAVIARTLFPDSYVSHGGSTNIADVQLAEGQSQLIAVFGFIDNRENSKAASATVTVNGSDGAELASFEVPVEEAVEMPINVANHQTLRFTFTYKDSAGNPAENTGFAVASLHAQ